VLLARHRERRPGVAPERDVRVELVRGGPEALPVLAGDHGAAPIEHEQRPRLEQVAFRVGDEHQARDDPHTAPGDLHARPDTIPG
jgi:hypothetical protein